MCQSTRTCTNVPTIRDLQTVATLLSMTSGEGLHQHVTCMTSATTVAWVSNFHVVTATKSSTIKWCKHVQETLVVRSTPSSTSLVQASLEVPSTLTMRYKCVSEHVYRVCSLRSRSPPGLQTDDRAETCSNLFKLVQTCSNLFKWNSRLEKNGKTLPKWIFGVSSRNCENVGWTN